MDAIKAVQFYLNRMLSDVPGMKVLLLDDETTTIISLAYTQSQLLAKEVFLIDKLSNVSREKMKHMKCVCFLRPMDDAIQAVIDELRDPKYMKYYLYFTNTLRKSSLERLAEADEFEAVCEVQEYYADYLAINPTLCALPLLGPEHPLTGEQPQVWDARALNRSVEGVLAILLSLKKKPLIRYERQSPLAKKLASEVQYQIGQEGQLFDFRKADTPPILLIVDRMSDPVTPLLTQWTYQAMVHELIGIVNGRVDLSYVKDARPELRDIVLSCEHDTFYRQNMFLDLGDLGANIKTYVEEYQVKHKSNMQIESITDMKRFMEDYPDFRKLSGNVTKHVTLVGELSRLVGEQQLMAVGELEQNLAAVDSHATDLRALQALLETPGIPDSAKLRLVLLYALRYERHPNSALPQLTDALARGGLSEGKMRLVADLLAAARPEQRAEDHGDPADVFARTKHVLRGLKGVENVFTQHTPRLVRTLRDLLRGRLRDAAYPFVDGATRDKPQDVVVFVVGGVTYAEAREVHVLNAETPGVRILLSGTAVHNSASFLRDVSLAAARYRKSSGGGGGMGGASPPGRGAA